MQAEHSLRRFIKYLWLAALLVSLLVPPGAPIGQAAPPEQKPDGSGAAEQETFPTNEWAVQLVPGAAPDAIAAQYAFENLGQVGTLANIYLLRRPPTHVKDADPERLRAAPEVVWLEQQIARQQHKRIIPTDPLYANQWHLNNTGQSGGTAGQDINVVPVWNNDIMGTGVVIGVVDDGLQHTHSDLSPNYVSSASYDFNDGDPDPSPNVTLDRHGTSVGGVAAARDNSTCGVGSAFRAGLSGLRLIAAPSTDADEASALTYQYNTNDIFSNSWGPSDDGVGLEGPGTLTRAALQDGVTNGRSGLGNIYVWAAGNGLEYNDNVNYDGYANSRFTIAVGAVDHDGVQSYYSEPGAAMLVTAPSSGDGVGVTTTDLSGANGYDSGDCTDTFGGTSSATPLVSGLIALMLEANPNLTWRDVQHILVETAVQNDSGDSDWTTNGAGHLVNHKYGFGRVDAAAAVSAASSWTNVGPATSVDSGVINVSQSIPDNNPTGVTSNFVVNDNITLEHVEVIFDATHTYRGDLEIVLTSPSGTQSILAELHGDPGNDYDNWQFMTVRNWGESSQGTWSLRVSDRFADDTGTFNSWRLVLHGTSTGPPIPATCPFNDGFESGTLGTGWTTYTTSEGQVRVSSSYPYAGAYSVLLDDSTGNSTYSYAASILTMDLSSLSEVELDFWWREFNDENDPEDGVFISDDYGVNWYQVLSFNDGPSTFRNDVIDIDAAAATNGLDLNDHFQIKFQFYDNYPITSDGYAIDEVQLLCAGGQPDLGYHSHTVDDDNSGDSSGNNDGIVNCGETIELYVTLQNSGTDTATAVNACISEDSSYVDGFLSNVCSDFGDISGGGTGTNSDDFDFEVDPSTPDGHVIHFDLEDITASNGGPWTDSFDVSVSCPTMACKILFDETHGYATDFVVGDIIIEDGLSDLAALLTGAGATVDSLTSPATFDYATISQYDILALVLPQSSYSSSERDDINTFVQNGGRLVVVGDWRGWTPADTSRPILNQVLSSLGTGIALNDDHVEDPTNNDGANHWPIIHQFSTAPVNQGVGQVVEYAGASLDVNSPGYATAWGDDDSYVTLSTALSTVERNAAGLLPHSPELSGGSDKQAKEPADPTAKRATQVQGGGQIAPADIGAQDTLSEGFEAGTMPPAGWTHIQTNPNETWEIETFDPHSGTYYAHVLYDSALLDQDEVLLSPTFTADSGSVALWSYGNTYWCRDDNDNCDLEVWFVNGNWDGGGGDDVYLGLVDDDWTGTWVWSTSTFDFSAYASGNPARIALRYVGNDGAEIAVDDILIDYSTSGSTMPVMAMADVVSGDVFVIGDVNVWTNDDPDGDSTGSLSEYDNAQLALNVFSCGGGDGGKIFLPLILKNY